MEEKSYFLFLPLGIFRNQHRQVFVNPPLGQERLEALLEGDVEVFKLRADIRSPTGIIRFRGQVVRELGVRVKRHGLDVEDALLGEGFDRERTPGGLGDRDRTPDGEDGAGAFVLFCFALFVERRLGVLDFGNAKHYTNAV